MEDVTVERPIVGALNSKRTGRNCTDYCSSGFSGSSGKKSLKNLCSMVRAANQDICWALRAIVLKFEHREEKSTGSFAHSMEEQRVLILVVKDWSIGR
jgi:hypothetical protein